MTAVLYCGMSSTVLTEGTLSEMARKGRPLPAPSIRRAKSAVRTTIGIGWEKPSAWARSGDEGADSRTIWLRRDLGEGHLMRGLGTPEVWKCVAAVARHISGECRRDAEPDCGDCGE